MVASLVRLPPKAIARVRIRTMFRPTESGLPAAALTESSSDGRLTVARDDAEHWLPALTDLRLVLAERLGIHNDDDLLPESELADVYQWLGELQWSLIEALD